jgi:hypothetical protein
MYMYLITNLRRVHPSSKSDIFDPFLEAHYFPLKSFTSSRLERSTSIIILDRYTRQTTIPQLRGIYIKF